MLESAGFDFRNRYPQKLLIKIAKDCGLDRDSVGKIAYNICLDLYRTFAPLKQTASTLAIASIELAVRLCDSSLLERIVGDNGINLNSWGTQSAEVMGELQYS